MDCLAGVSPRRARALGVPAAIEDSTSRMYPSRALFMRTANVKLTTHQEVTEQLEEAA